MAVFKPTNCSPYLTAFDITYLDEGPIYFQCKIDTSNTKIDGYAITVYDNDNNQVFPHSGNAVDNISYIKDLYQDTTRMGSIISNDGISDLNTGLNGSYLKIPFVVNKDQNERLTNTTRKNVVVYNKKIDGSYEIKDNFANIIKLYNGNQYKWTITLFQLGQKAVDDDRHRPEDIKYYDMTVASGKILGSTNERIQSYPSDQIYNDYFIQLYSAPVVNVGSDFQIAAKITGNVKQVGTRVRIKDYDSYLGHMYLQTGQDGLSEENLKTSNVFQVFKMSNNPDDLGIKDKVDFCISKKYFVPKFFQKSESDSSAAYLAQTFVIEKVTGSDASETLENLKKVYNKPFFENTEDLYPYQFNQYYSKIFSGYDRDESPAVIFGQSRVLLNTENDNNELDKNTGAFVNGPSYRPNTGSSKFNGIWIPKTPTVEKIKDNYSGDQYVADYKVTIQWYRSSDADTWGEITNKVVLDTNSFNSDYDSFAGQNIQAYTSAQEGEQVTTGTINNTPIKFKKEKSVEIYPNNPNEKNYGVIYKNKMQLTSATGETMSQIINFISPSVAISVGDKIFNKDNSSSDIVFLDKTVWAIGQDSISNFKTNDLYSIKTFFRSSSENQFSLYERPTVDLKLQGVSGGANIEIKADNTCETKERSIFAQATYNQTNLVQWRNYQWFLYDVPNIYENADAYKTAAQSALTTYLNPNNLILKSEVGYDKEIKYTFYGLAEVNHWYIISLVLTDQYGTIITKRVAVYTEFTVNLETKTDWANYGLRCDLTGVDMWFEDKYGYIYPNLVDRNFLKIPNDYEDNPTGVKYIDETMYITNDSKGVLYDGVYGNDGLNSWNSPSKQNITFDQTDGIEFTTSITIKTYQYSAEFLNVVINTDGGQIKNLVLKPEDLYISSDQWPEGYKVGFPNYECYKIGDYAIGNNSKIYDYGNATTDLFPSSYKNYIENNNYYISYIPSNVVPLGANKLDRNNEDHWYFIDYNEENNVEDIISDKPIKINKMIYDLNDTDGLQNKDVFYNFPIFINNDLSLSGKTIGDLPAGTKVYSLWMDKKDEIIIPTVVAINESADTVYYCYRKVNNHQKEDNTWEDNTWEDKNENGEDNYWEDKTTAKKTQSKHLRNEDDSLNTIRNRLYNKTLNFYVRWRVSENDNITYEIDGEVSQNTKNVASELSLTSVTGEGENG